MSQVCAVYWYFELEEWVTNFIESFRNPFQTSSYSVKQALEKAAS